MRGAIRARPAWDDLEARVCQSGLAPSAVLSSMPAWLSTPASLAKDMAYQESMFRSHDQDGVEGASIVAAPRTDPYIVFLQQQALAQVVAANPRVVFLGDSMLSDLQVEPGLDAWKQTLAPLGAVNASIPGDATQNVLWEIQNGILQTHPAVVVLGVGANNIGAGGGFQPADETAAGIRLDVAAIRAMSPGSKILLLGLFPTNPPTAWLRGVQLVVDRQIAGLADGRTVRFFNPGPVLVAPDGTNTGTFESDLVHPNAVGYQLLANALAPVIEQMLATPVTAPAQAAPSFRRA